MEQSIKRAFKCVYPEKTISMDAVHYLNELCNIFLARIVNSPHLSVFLLRENIEDALLPDHSPYFIKEVEKSFNKYYKDGTLKNDVFSEKSIKNWLKTNEIVTYCSVDVLFLSTVLEYLCLEISELAGKEATKQRRTRVSVDHIKEGIKKDEMLSHFFKRHL